MLFLHDPEHIPFDEAMAGGGPVEALLRMRDEGLVDHMGIAGGPAALLRRFVDTGVLDALITHNRVTLVDRTADELLSVASDAGLGVYNAAVYGGGLLSVWPRTGNRYAYGTASPAVLAAVDAMGAACERHGVPLIAAALQASVRDERIHSTICGMVSRAQLDETIWLLELELPDELWHELDALRPDRSTWIDD